VENEKLPKRLFLKTQSTPLLPLLYMELSQWTRTETSIYSTNVDLGIKIPTCLYSKYDSLSGDYLIILKDESDIFEPLDQCKQYDLSLNLAIVENISKLHSKFWFQKLPSWVTSSKDFVNLNHQIYKQMFKNFVPNVKKFNIPKSVEKFCVENSTNYISNYDIVYNKIPFTVNHM
jgi:hypothetical protein